MKKQIVFTLGLALTAALAIGQTGYQAAPVEAGMYSAHVSFSEGAEPIYVPGTVLLKKQDQFVPSTEVALLHTERDALSMEHTRYQQKMNNIPVEGAVYIMHVANGKVKSMNGVWVASDPAELAQTPSISEDVALQAAMAAFGAESYKWQIPSEESLLQEQLKNPAASFRPKAELVYYSGEAGVKSENLRLAYKLNLYAHEPLGRRIYFIDAENGEVLGMRNMLHEANANGTAVTGYSGNRTIASDNVTATSFRLRESGRGSGIGTFNMNHGTSYAVVDFTDDDNVWNNANTNLDQYAADAHWGAEMTYDYYLNTYGRNSIDNNGMAIYSYVHYSTNFYNAFWDGLRMTYGDGYGKPLTSLDVCGHEITHGVTEHTAGLVYSDEPGALNEGFSDIFGTCVEFYARPNAADWLLGGDFGAFRNMSNPKAYGDPNTYKGINWATGTADQGGVHTNSGVLNYWFYLLTQGGSGTNDNALSYTVSGIGKTKAAAIAYRTLSAYLTPMSQYIDARNYSIQAATDLYGPGANEVVQTIKAWDAVGVTSTTTAPPTSCTDNYESNENRQSAKTLTVNTDLTARIGSATDKDWFVVTTTTAAPKLKLTLRNLPANYDLYLYNNKGKQIASSKNSGNTLESITYNAPTTGATYYVSVSGVNGATSASCYWLRAGTSTMNQLTDVEGNSMVDDNEGIGAGGSLTAVQSELRLFPNPAKDQVNVSFNAEEAGTTNISITDIVGRVMMNQTVSVQPGSNTISLPLNYMTGIYFLNASGHTPMRFHILQ